jgi:hypothetical protein
MWVLFELLGFLLKKLLIDDFRLLIETHFLNFQFHPSRLRFPVLQSKNQKSTISFRLTSRPSSVYNGSSFQ